MHNIWVQNVLTLQHLDSVYGGGAYSFVDFLSGMTIDHTSLARQHLQGTNDNKGHSDDDAFGLEHMCHLNRDLYCHLYSSLLQEYLHWKKLARRRVTFSSEVSQRRIHQILSSPKSLRKGAWKSPLDSFHQPPLSFDNSGGASGVWQAQNLPAEASSRICIE